MIARHLQSQPLAIETLFVKLKKNLEKNLLKI